MLFICHSFQTSRCNDMGRHHRSALELRPDPHDYWLKGLNGVLPKEPLSIVNSAIVVADKQHTMKHYQFTQ